MDMNKVMAPEMGEPQKLMLTITEIRSGLFGVLESFIDIGDNIVEGVSEKKTVAEAERLIAETANKVVAFLDSVETFKPNMTNYTANAVTTFLYEFSRLVADFDDSAVTAFKGLADQLRESQNDAHKVASDNGLVVY